MSEDDLTQLMLVREPRRSGAAPSVDSQPQPPVTVRAPTVGSRSAGETFFGDTDAGVDESAREASHIINRPETRADPSPRHVRQFSPKPQATHTFGVRGAVAVAAVFGIVLALGLSLSAREQTPHLPADTHDKSKLTQLATQVDHALTPPSRLGPPTRPAPSLQVFPFEMSEQEAQWAEQAHAAAQRGECSQALELYQRLVNLSAGTKESRVFGMSRWLPFLEQVRRRCVTTTESKPPLTGAP